MPWDIYSWGNNPFAFIDGYAKVRGGNSSESVTRTLQFQAPIKIFSLHANPKAWTPSWRTAQIGLSLPLFLCQNFPVHKIEMLHSKHIVIQQTNACFVEPSNFGTYWDWIEQWIWHDIWQNARYMSYGTPHDFFQVRFWPGLDPGQDIYTKTPDLYYWLILPQQIFMTRYLGKKFQTWIMTI